ncbi:MAG: hypothetical protein U9Q12_02785 [Patescibacteria group bacterium]|nr:hypothetical protein [Patescibacteria group bacterium]
MITPEDQYIHSRTVDNTPLSNEEQIFYNWYIKNNQENRATQMQLLDMDEFSELYSNTKIQNDKNWVKTQRDKGNQKDHTERAEIAEYIIKTFANDSEWLGKDSAISETLEYDDRKHHTDFIAEWDNGEGEVDCALAIDCTVSDYAPTINNKVAKITRDINKKKLTSIEYHNSEMTGEQSALEQVPRVLIVFNKKTLQELCKKLIVHTDEEEYYDQERDSYMQLYFLQTIKSQLDAQIEYIKSLPQCKEAGGCDEILNNTIKVFDRIHKEFRAKEKDLSENVIKQASYEYKLAENKIQAALKAYERK